ncbi:MAG: hypothetical protein WBD48_01390 [Pseudolabrys sp.]
MVVSDRPIAWDFQRWRRILASYRIDGQPVLEPARDQDRALLNQFMSWQGSLAPSNGRVIDRPIEPCPDVLARTAGKLAVTDDNMGSEWRHFLHLE